MRRADAMAHLDSSNTFMVLHLVKCNGGGMESAITIKGQATIPKAIREHLRLKPGDRVKFFVHPDGSVVLLPKLSASALRGIIKSRRRRPVTIAEMNEAAGEGAAVPPRAKRR
jgi:antitoxin PrlF